MRCTYHADRDAALRCSQCKKPLCQDCAMAEGKDTFICTQCMALKAAQEMVQGTQERRQEQEEKRQVRKAKKKSRYLTILIPASSILAVILLGMNFYFRATIPLSKASDQPEHPLVKMIILDEALQDYANDHEGMYPTDLSELSAEYVPPEVMNRDDLKDFAYKRPSPRSYELRPGKTDSEDLSDVVFTEED